MSLQTYIAFTESKSLINQKSFYVNLTGFSSLRVLSKVFSHQVDHEIVILCMKFLYVIKRKVKIVDDCQLIEHNEIYISRN